MPPSLNNVRHEDMERKLIVIKNSCEAFKFFVALTAKTTTGISFRREDYWNPRTKYD